MSQFRNLVFEGGGVKGIAYVGALRVLEEMDMIQDVKRAGGTSAGAINATLLAVGYSIDEQLEILKAMDFNRFMDDSFGVVRDTDRLLSEYGWYKGEYFFEWMAELIGKKLGSGNATFRDLQEAGGPDLFVYGANLSTGFGEVFSEEHTPNERIADAVRISMSLPLFFKAIKRGARGDVYVDGGALNNYPVKLFDRLKYIDESDHETAARKTPYYDKVNTKFLKKHPGRSPYVFNQQTLGFRLDSANEIAVFRDGREPVAEKVEDFFDYVRALMRTVMNAQENLHLHADDWHRTVYIDTLEVGTTDFDLKDKQKDALISSGDKGTRNYLTWFNNPESEPLNRAAS